MQQSLPRGVFWRPDRDEYWIRYAGIDGGDRRESAGTLTRAAELVEQRRREVRFARQSPELAAAQKPVYFREIMDDALDYCKRHAGYRNDVFQAKRMLEWWDDRRAVSITPQEIEARFSSMMRINRNAQGAAERPVSTGTFNRYRSLLALTYKRAQKLGKVPAGFNPASMVPKRKEAKRVRWLKADEEARLREVMAREYGDGVEMALLDLALNCGLRWSDQAGLAAEQRDGDLLRVDVHKTGTPLLLPLNKMAANAFETLIDNGGRARRGPGRNRLVPTKNPRHWFERVCKLAEIPDLHWHDLRHTFATRLLQEDVPMERVQKYLAHKSPEMTARYAHIQEGQYDAGDLAKLSQHNARCATGGAKVTTMPAKPPIRTQIGERKRRKASA